MNLKLEKLSDQWHELVAKAKRTELISDEELLAVFKKTHRVFDSLREMDLVPRKAVQIVMLMDEFTYYASIMDENYMGDICPGLYYLNYALKNEFFKGENTSEFFVGVEPSEIKQYVLDIENISVEDFVRFLKDELDIDFNRVVFRDGKNNKGVCLQCLCQSFD